MVALTGESNLHSRFRRELRNPVRIQAVNAGLIERPNGVIEIGGHSAGVQSNDLKRDVQRLRGAAAQFSFIEFGFAESNGHRGKIRGARLSGSGSQASRIGASAQKKQ